MLRVHSLYRYPIKSCGGVQVHELALDDFGPQWDRRWMIVEPDGTFVTQRQFPSMALLQPVFQGEDIFLQSPQHETSLRLKKPTEGERRPVRVWRSRVEALDAGEEAAEWLSDYLGFKARLVFMDDECVRTMNPDFAPQDRKVSFADGYPLLITTVESLQALNELEEMTTPVSMAHFRPNLVLEGAESWDEHTWSRIQIGNIEFSLVKPCTRCSIVNINPNSGSMESSTNLRVLSQYRRSTSGAVFGENAIHSQPGLLTEGQEVVVLETKPSFPTYSEARFSV